VYIQTQTDHRAAMLKGNSGPLPMAKPSNQEQIKSRNARLANAVTSKVSTSKNSLNPLSAKHLLTYEGERGFHEFLGRKLIEYNST